MYEHGTGEGLGPIPRALYRADQTRELDRIAMEEFGLGDGALMERAGAAAFAFLRRRWPGAKQVVVVCGRGNNGGDGYVLARLGREAGLTAQVLMVAGAPNSGDAASAHDRARAAGVAMADFDEAALGGVDVIVDAVLGTGVERTVEGEWARALEAIGEATSPVLALDVPSGLHADSGRVLGTAVQADATMSFIGLKAGLFTADGPDCAGQILFDDLGVPEEIYRRVDPYVLRIGHGSLDGVLPRRRRNSHKGSFGTVLVIGGGPGMPGAACLAGEAAYRVGAGRVLLGTHGSHAPYINAMHPELIGHDLSEPDALADLARVADVIAIGPGLGQSSWAQRLFACTLESDRPKVVDADALNLLAREPMQRDDWVLTPHPGEAGRLLATATASVQADRYGSAESLAQTYGGVAVLKGAGTVVAAADGLSVCDRGGPVLASAGTGDVLTGAVAGLLAQGVAPAPAARMAVWVHACAGEMLAAGGERGGLARELLPLLREPLRQLQTHD
jgi:hydroxyethylthiazole kinase-like uncharacterized protein yjeF